MSLFSRVSGIEQIRDRVSAGETSAVHLMLATLERVEAASALNIFTQLNTETALRRAERIDKLLVDEPKRAASLPLLGVPLAHKDLFWRHGQAPGCGAKHPLTDAVGATATVISRLEAAGAITIGALHLAEFALGATGFNAHLGPCVNPQHPDRVVGGSSSGSAAAVAAGLVSAALGSDTGGSIRQPASMCGLTGLKPGHGCVPLDGVFPLAPSLDCVGPIAASAKDCRLIFELLVGADNSSGVAVELSRLKLACLQGGVFDDLASETACAFDTALGVLSSFGVELKSRCWPGHGAADRAFAAVFGFEAARTHQARLAEDPGQFGATVLARLRAGAAVEKETYCQALELKSEAVNAFLNDVMKDAHAVVLSSLPVPVPAFDRRVENDSARALPLNECLTRFNRVFNFLGLPCLTLPCGVDNGGSSVSMQLVGRPGGEVQILRLAEAIQASSPVTKTDAFGQNVMKSPGNGQAR